MAETPVDDDVLASLFEAARWAPSSFNIQPWRFVVTTHRTPEARDRLRGLLSEGNAWARRAPVLILSAYQTRNPRTERPNRLALRDLGAAEENLFLEAVNRGLVMHHMAGFDTEAAGRLLPDGFAPGCMSALGHPGEIADLAPSKREGESAPRRRRPLGESVFLGEWGRAPRWI
jgi:nitroreductase